MGVVVGPKAATSLLRKPSTTEWSFAKLFGDDDFIAAGQVCIHPNCEKPSKNVKDNTYVRVFLDFSENHIEFLFPNNYGTTIDQSPEMDMKLLSPRGTMNIPPEATV